MISFERKPPIIVPLIQGSPEWLEWRKSGIGGSEAARIMGIYPWEDAIELFYKKKGLVAPIEPNEAMMRGTRLEPEARLMFEMEELQPFPSQCVAHPDIPWLIASLDGLSVDGGELLEIKCPGITTHTKALKGQVPVYYWCQMQHQFAASGASVGYYYSYMPEVGGKKIKVYPDYAYIDRLLTRESLWWDYFLRDIEPPATLFDVADGGGDGNGARSDPKWREAAREWLEANGVFRDAEAQLSARTSEIARLMQRKKQGIAFGAGISARQIIEGERVVTQVEEMEISYGI